MSRRTDISSLGRDRRSESDRFGPFKVEEKIASGGMAEIFKVVHEDDPTRCWALKRIRPDCDEDPEFRNMLMDEAKIASSLHHENIARVYEVVEHDGQLGLVLEHVDGLDLGRLKRVIKNSNYRFSLELAIHIVREVLEGLDYAHNAKDERGEYLNIVHRDISPGNVMVDIHGRVRIVDFGIARAQNRLAKTEAGNVKGKFRYMSPEQIKGLSVGPHTDVYSAAVVLWELLAGRRIYDDVSVAQLMLSVANAQVPSLEGIRPELPRGLFSVMSRATALSPEQRYRSARALADALDGLLAEYDYLRCQRELRQLLNVARCQDTQRHYDRAVIRARFAAEHDDLERAILIALEDPDRVERVDVRRHDIEIVDGTQLPRSTLPPPRRRSPPPLPSEVEVAEPPTMPMAIPDEIPTPSHI